MDSSMRPGLVSVLFPLILSCSVAPPPKTVAEASAWTETSGHADVLRFLDALEAMPSARRLHRATLGKSGEGREIPLIVVADPPLENAEAVRASDKLRILINANIHAGEVEGKEAVQALLRDLASGDYADLLTKTVLLFVPIFNADGNERIDKKNRVSQNGPDGGVGVRRNAADLDLNRDFIKLESPECRALVRAFARYDPQLFIDLHTTNGSHHGYHLTYSPSLSPNVDPELDRFVREVHLPAVRKAMLEDHGFRVFDYGNFKGRPARPAAGWATYDSRPRFGTNYFGLRNRIAVLSEAYSYISFEERVAVTYAFVVENLRVAAANGDRIHALLDAADARCIAGEGVPFGHATELAPPHEDEVLVGSVRSVELPEGVRRVANADFERERIPVQDAFVAKEWRDLPSAWVILRPSDALVRNLENHGLPFERVANARKARIEAFVETGAHRASRAFEGHRLLTLEGRYVELVEPFVVPAGSLVVDARQRLARVAAQLFEAQSEDSLATWNFFDGHASIDGDPADYPVLRVLSWVDAR